VLDDLPERRAVKSIAMDFLLDLAYSQIMTYE